MIQQSFVILLDFEVPTSVCQHCNLLMKHVQSAGIGTGAGSAIFGFLTRNTAPEDRATVFAAVMACRQAGLLIGQ